jgi:hypothetical protein
VYIGLLEKLWAVKMQGREDAIHLCHARWFRFPERTNARHTATEWPDRDPRKPDAVLELPARMMPATRDPIMETLSLIGRVVCVPSRAPTTTGNTTGFVDGERLWCEDVDLDYLKYAYRVSVSQ